MRKITQLSAGQAEDETVVILAVDDQGQGWKLIGLSGQKWLPLPPLPEEVRHA